MNFIILHIGTIYACIRFYFISHAFLAVLKLKTIKQNNKV